MTKNILLLGGAGYLGDAIAEVFFNKNSYQITVGDLVKPKNPKFNFVYCDILDEQRIDHCIKEYDTIINCTGQLTYPMNLCFNLNTKGIENIANAVNRNNKNLFHISTLAVYGTCEYADESSPINPESSYAACKAFAEYQIRKFLPKESYCILRLSNLYGGMQEKGVFAYLLNSLKSDKHLYFNNNGSLLRYFLHIDDCANAIYLAVRNNLNGIYNVAADEKYNIKEIISLIEQTCNIKFSVTYAQIEPYENISKLNLNAFINDTGFNPQITIPIFIKKAFNKYAHR